MTNHSMQQDIWWKAFFNTKYLKTYRDMLTPDITSRQVSFLVSALRLKKNSRILDLACGFGRHSIELARRGFSVVGLDYAPEQLRLARAQAKREVVKRVRFVRGDMRQLHYRGRFDAILNLFTSFGYFTDKQDHIRVIQGVIRALKYGGVFLIDIANAKRIIALLKKKGAKNKKTGLFTMVRDDVLTNGLRVSTIESYNPKDKRWAAERKWKERGIIHSYRSSVRLFTRKELAYLLENNGLMILRIWGNYRGEVYAPDSPRLLMLAQKKACPAVARKTMRNVEPASSRRVAR